MWWMSLGSLQRRLVSMCCGGRSRLYVEMGAVFCVSTSVSEVSSAASCGCVGAVHTRGKEAWTPASSVWLCADAEVLEDGCESVVYIRRCLNVFLPLKCCTVHGQCFLVTCRRMPQVRSSGCVSGVCRPRCPMFDEVCCSRRRQWCVCFAS